MSDTEARDQLAQIIAYIHGLGLEAAVDILYRQSREPVIVIVLPEVTEALSGLTFGKEHDDARYHHVNRPTN